MSHPAERCRVPAKLGVPAGLIWFESRMELRSCFRSHRRDLWAGTVRWKRIRHWPGADAAPKAAVRRSYQLWVLNHVLKMFYLFIFLKNVFHLQLVGSECNGNTSGQEREREMNEMNIMDLERSNCIDSGCWEFRLEGHRGFSIQFDLTQKSVRVLESWKWAIKSRKESCRIFTNVVNASIHLPEFEFFFFSNPERILQNLWNMFWHLRKIASRVFQNPWKCCRICQGSQRILYRVRVTKFSRSQFRCDSIQSMKENIIFMGEFWSWKEKKKSSTILPQLQVPIPRKGDDGGDGGEG